MSVWLAEPSSGPGVLGYLVWGGESCMVPSDRYQGPEWRPDCGTGQCSSSLGAGRLLPITENRREAV